MKIGFLGGTGIEGKGLALRFAQAGTEVILGSRSEERARAAAEDYNRILGGDTIRGVANREMLATADLIFLTVPSDQVLAAVDSCRADFSAGCVLVDVTVPMRFRDGKPEYFESPPGSNAERIAEQLPPGIQLVGAFKTIPAHVLAEIEIPLECDVFVCGNDAEAKKRVMQAAELIPSLRALDAGPLSAARTLERMTVLAVHLNRKYKKKAARYHIVGL